MSTILEVTVALDVAALIRAARAPKSLFRKITIDLSKLTQEDRDVIAEYVQWKILPSIAAGGSPVHGFVLLKYIRVPLTGNVDEFPEAVVAEACHKYRTEAKATLPRHPFGSGTAFQPCRGESK